MAEPAAAADALTKTRAAITNIRTRIQPFLDQLNKGRDNKKSTSTQTALAQSAVALSLGTLRVMRARLQGLDQGGRKPNDPLRQQLNHTREILIKAQTKQKEERAKVAALAKKQAESPPHTSSSFKTLKKNSGTKKKRSKLESEQEKEEEVEQDVKPKAKRRKDT
jgi:hypothetical protein